MILRVKFCILHNSTVDNVELYVLAAVRKICFYHAAKFHKVGIGLDGCGMYLHIHKGALIGILINLHGALENGDRAAYVLAMIGRKRGIGKNITAFASVGSSAGNCTAGLVCGNGNCVWGNMSAIGGRIFGAGIRKEFVYLGYHKVSFVNVIAVFGGLNKVAAHIVIAFPVSVKSREKLCHSVFLFVKNKLFYGAKGIAYVYSADSAKTAAVFYGKLFIKQILAIGYAVFHKCAAEGVGEEVSLDDELYVVSFSSHAQQIFELLFKGCVEFVKAFHFCNVAAFNAYVLLGMTAETVVHEYVESLGDDEERYYLSPAAEGNVSVNAACHAVVAGIFESHTVVGKEVYVAFISYECGHADTAPYNF